MLGALNGRRKVDLTRRGPLRRRGIFGHYYAIPVADVLSTVGAGSLIEGAEGLTGHGERRPTSACGAGASLQLAKPWSVHGRASAARPSAKGEILASLPEALLPALARGQQRDRPRGDGDLLILNVATDLRLDPGATACTSRRAGRSTRRVRGTTSGTIGGFEQLANADFMIAYGQHIPLATSLSVAGGCRRPGSAWTRGIGIGWSAVPYTWLMQAFELSYKFGGPTRREEKQCPGASGGHQRNGRRAVRHGSQRGDSSQR